MTPEQFSADVASAIEYVKPIIVESDGYPMEHTANDLRTLLINAFISGREYERRDTLVSPAPETAEDAMIADSMLTPTPEVVAPPPPAVDLEQIKRECEYWLDDSRCSQRALYEARQLFAKLFAEIERLQALAPEIRKFAPTQDGPCVGCLQTVCTCGKLVAPERKKEQ